MRRLPPAAWLLGIIPMLFVGALTTLFVMAARYPEPAAQIEATPLSKTSWREPAAAEPTPKATLRSPARS